MIVYKRDGSEIEYGRTKRVYQYNKPDEDLPSWLTIQGDFSVTSQDNFLIERGALSTEGLTTRAFLLSNIDALRFSVNNFRKSATNSLVKFQLISEDETVLLEYKTINTAGTGVGLYLNNELIVEIDKFNFNGLLVNKPRKIGMHYNPNTGYVAMLENNYVVHGMVLSEKLNASKKYMFRIVAGHNSITLSEVEIINWVSL